MRLIDLYRETSAGIVPVTAGCIQTGVTDVRRGVQSKFYTMADGTVCCYPCETAKTAMTLSLECTRTQAAAIEAAAGCGSLLIAGLRFGTNYGTHTVDPFGLGYRGFPTGEVEITEAFALTGIYAVTIPLLLDASGETYRTSAVPAIVPGTFSLDGVAEPRRALPQISVLILTPSPSIWLPKAYTHIFRTLYVSPF